MKTAKTVVLAVVLAMVSTPAFAGWVNDVKSYHAQGRTQDASDILQANMSEASISDADKLLKAGLTDMASNVYLNIGRYAENNKTQAKAWFKLGMVKVDEGSTSCASHFSKAIAHHPGKYDSKVGTALYQAGLNAFEKGNYSGADFFAKEVAKHGGSASALRAEYKTRAITIAKSNIQSGNINAGKQMINLAMKNGYSSKAAHQMVITVGHNTKPGQLMVDIYTYANELCSAKCDGSRKAGVRIAGYARSIEDPEVFSANIAAMIHLAISMTNKEDNVKPYIVTHVPGEYSFDFKKGDNIGYWIQTPKGLRIDCEFFSDNKKFDILYSNGKRVRVWKGEQAPTINNSFAFKVFPVEDTFVGLVFATR